MSSQLFNPPAEQQLLLAVDSGDVALMHQLVENANINGELAVAVLQNLLLRSLESGNFAVMQYLVDHGADIHATDINGKTLLMTAVIRGIPELVYLLASKGANVNAKDLRGRNVLHYLALEEGQDRNRQNDIIDHFVKSKVDVNARDELSQAPLHLACTSGNEGFVRHVLTSSTGKTDANATDFSGKTPLHLAATYGRTNITQLLIEHGADVNAQDIGGCTPLHNACKQGNEENVNLLLNANADINTTLTDGTTPLHVAAQGGHVKVIERLLDCKDSKLMYRDGFGSTAFLRAVDSRQTAAMDILAPFNHRNVEKLSNHARSACERLYATIIDFGYCHGGNSKHRIRKVAIYDLLYTDMSIVPKFLEDSNLLPDSTKVNFSWIHLPANNFDWVEALLAKRFYESKNDFSSLDTLKSTLKIQSRGQYNSSSFTKPTFYLQGSQARTTGHSRGTPAAGYSYVSLPYLHFETNQGRSAMAGAIKRAQYGLKPRPSHTKAMSAYEMMIQAYLVPQASIHVRQTLEQTWFCNKNTGGLNQDQVVLRSDQYGQNDDVNTEVKLIMVDQLWMWTSSDKFLVTAFPELWQQPTFDPMDVLNDIIGDLEASGQCPASTFDLSTVVASRCCSIFDRLHAGKNRVQVLHMFKTAVSDVVFRERSLYQNFEEASTQAAQWLVHKQEFEEETPRDRSSPHFLQVLINNTEEIEVLLRADAIKDEIHMLQRVFEVQVPVIRDFYEGMGNLSGSGRDRRDELLASQLRLEDELERIRTRLQDLAELHLKMEHVRTSVLLLLDMKQKHAGMFGALFSRDQTDQLAESADQSTSLFIFTVVAIIFLPMSFISSFFTINIKEFPKDNEGNSELPLAMVSKYVFGIGLGISLLLVIISIYVGDLATSFKQALRGWIRRRNARRFLFRT